MIPVKMLFDRVNRPPGKPNRCSISRRDQSSGGVPVPAGSLAVTSVYATLLETSIHHCCTNKHQDRSKNDLDHAVFRVPRTHVNDADHACTESE